MWRIEFLFVACLDYGIGFAGEAGRALVATYLVVADCFFSALTVSFYSMITLPDFTAEIFRYLTVGGITCKKSAISGIKSLSPSQILIFDDMPMDSVSKQLLISLPLLPDFLSRV